MYNVLCSDTLLHLNPRFGMLPSNAPRRHHPTLRPLTALLLSLAIIRSGGYCDLEHLVLGQNQMHGVDKL